MLLGRWSGLFIWIYIMKLLSLSLDLELIALRQAVMTAAGHHVTSLNTEKDALASAESSDRYDVVLLCHRFPSATARQVVRLMRQHHPATRLVFISHMYGEWPEVEADRYIVGADGAAALLRVLDEIRTEPSSLAEIGTP